MVFQFPRDFVFPAQRLRDIRLALPEQRCLTNRQLTTETLVEFSAQ